VTRDELMRVCFPGVRLPRHDLALEFDVGEAVFSTVAIFWRTVTFDGVPVPVCGIGSVATDPAWRRRGLASTLLDMAHKLALDRGVQVAALWSSLEDFYRERGYVSTEIPYFMVCPLVGTANGGPSLANPDTRGMRW
jgi:GNAT superfamily N-acetyltransferase